MASMAVPLLGAASGIIGGLGSFFGGQSAAQGYQNAANSANTTLGNTLNTITSAENPYTSAGSNAIGSLNSQMSSGTGFAAPFTMSNFYNSPGYQFTLQQGQQAINNSAAAKGGLLSGATSKAMASFGSGLANNTFQNAYNNYLNSSNQSYNQLMGVAGLGQNAQGQVNSAGMQVGSQQAQNTFGAGVMGASAQAAGLQGLMGGAAQSANSLGGYYMAKQMGMIP